jgi:menaquinone-9 beta-reductase
LNQYDVVIIGGGPGGLACARKLAEMKKSVLLVERKKRIGSKVCAGGVTWSGLGQKLPEELVERSFCKQYIYSNWQHVIVENSDPIISTVNRYRLGQWMLKNAKQSGAEVRPGCLVRKIDKDRIETSQGTFGFKYLVGADGSSSLVRKYLNLPVNKIGIGINYTLPLNYERMEWHLNTRLFNHGYAWIFPHRQTISIGAYACRRWMSARTLKERCVEWANGQGFSLNGVKPQAELVNYDYQGCFFGNIFLVGDAAGLASGLTGEGIYSAILSGEAVAGAIIEPGYQDPGLKKLIKKHHQHSMVIPWLARKSLFNKLSMEVLVLGLKAGVIKFTTLEMGG